MIGRGNYSSHTPQVGGLTLREGIPIAFAACKERIEDLVGYAFSDTAECGRHGCAIVSVDREIVVKLTGDRDELPGWLFARELQRQQDLGGAAGFARVDDVWRARLQFPNLLGGGWPVTLSMCQMERLIPARHRHQTPADTQLLHHRVRPWLDDANELEKGLLGALDALGDACNSNNLVLLRRAVNRAPAPLQPLATLLLRAGEAEVWFEDVREYNVGWRIGRRAPCLALYDFGRVNLPRRIHTRLKKLEVPRVDLSRVSTRRTGRTSHARPPVVS